MQGDENIPRIPWSRHLIASPKTKRGSIGNGNRIDNYKNRQTAWESRRKEIRESSSERYVCVRKEETAYKFCSVLVHINIRYIYK